VIRYILERERERENMPVTMGLLEGTRERR
jgi:hypothetical protein